MKKINYMLGIIGVFIFIGFTNLLTPKRFLKTEIHAENIATTTLKTVVTTTKPKPLSQTTTTTKPKPLLQTTTTTKPKPLSQTTTSTTTIKYGNLYCGNVNDGSILVNGKKEPVYVMAVLSCDRNATGVIEIPGIVNGEPVKKIKKEAFDGCYGITKIILSENISSIENGFKYCENLESIEVSKNSQFFSSQNGILFSKDKKKLIQFPFGRKDKEIVVPDFVEVIGNNSLSELMNVETITLPSSVNQIEDRAFSGCYNLKTIIIPESVEKFGDALSYCSNLEKVVFLNPTCEISDNDETICTGWELIENGITIATFSGTIYGYEGSTAQAYAEKYGYKFEALKDEPETTTTSTTKAPAKTTTTAKNTTTTAVTSKAPVTTTTVPVQTSKALGDFTGDGKIDAVDASNILAKYASISTGGTVPTEQDQAVCDVNGDKKIDAVDASKVLAFYAYLSGGGDMSFTDYLKEN